MRIQHVHVVPMLVAALVAAFAARGSRMCQPHDSLDPWTSAGQTICLRELDLAREEYPLVTLRVQIVNGTAHFSEPPWAETNAFLRSTGRRGLLQNRMAAVVRLFTNLTKTAKLPDTDFVLNLGDLPVVRLWDTWPVLSFSSSPHHADILAPDPLINDRTLSWPLGALITRPPSQPPLPFSARAARAVFVDDFGEDSGMGVSTRHATTARLRRVAALRPDLLAKAAANDAEEVGQAKYVVIDRPWLASRVLHLGMSGSVPLIVTMQYQSYWCACLGEAGVHYLPIQPDLSDLASTISYLREREELAASIAARATAWAASCAEPEATHAYWKDLLRSYSALLSFRPLVRPQIRNFGPTRAEIDVLWQELP
jgi:hypothetical protein